MKYGEKDESTGLYCSCMCTAPESEQCDHKVKYDDFIGCDNEQTFICSFYFHTNVSYLFQMFNKRLDKLESIINLRR